MKIREIFQCTIISDDNITHSFLMMTGKGPYSISGREPDGSLYKGNAEWESGDEFVESNEHNISKFRLRLQYED